MNYKQEILDLIRDSKITNQAACEAMGISKNTFKFNKSNGNPRNNFTEKNYNDLRIYLESYGNRLMKILEENAFNQSANLK